MPSEMKTKNEIMAEIMHETFSHWMKYLFTVSAETMVGDVVIPAKYCEKWRRQMNTPFANLLESEKESDRKVVQDFKILERLEKAE